MRVVRAVLVLALVLALVALWSRRAGFEGAVDEAIVGGAPATKGRYPWFARIVHREGSFAAGVLVLPRIVLTAAHVAKNVTASTRVLVGKHTLHDAANVETRRVVGVRIHPNYSKQFWENDIALLLLDAPCTHRPVALAGIGEKAPRNLTAIGFGTTLPMRKRDPNRDVRWPKDLQEAQLTVHPCRRLLDAFAADKRPLAIGKLFAGGEHSTCKGDSGGPLFRKGRTADEDRVYGITSMSLSCGMGLPAAYSSVSHYASWIQTTMQQLLAA